MTFEIANRGVFPLIPYVEVHSVLDTAPKMFSFFQGIFSVRGVCVYVRERGRGVNIESLAPKLGFNVAAVKLLSINNSEDYLLTLRNFLRSLR